MVHKFNKLVYIYKWDNMLGGYNKFFSFLFVEMPIFSGGIEKWNKSNHQSKLNKNRVFFFSVCVEITCFEFCSRLITAAKQGILRLRVFAATQRMNMGRRSVLLIQLLLYSACSSISLEPPPSILPK